METIACRCERDVAKEGNWVLSKAMRTNVSEPRNLQRSILRRSQYGTGWFERWCWPRMPGNDASALISVYSGAMCHTSCSGAFDAAAFQWCSWAGVCCGRRLVSALV